jgi:4-diphosphocytidyl-2-C-methyl-D-erythritol kinase
VNGSPRDIVSIDAPAKLNLGLEILGRRPDGYHELATIFVAVDLRDRLTLRRSERLRLECADPELAGDDNLVVRALRAFQEAAGVREGATVALKKRIPAAAGLGGASSDAAAALLAARELWRVTVSDEELASVAAQVGSDVPFFLRGGCALGRGRGEMLEPLPVPLDTRFVVVAPAKAIPRKTATLYGELQPDDFSDGTRIAAQAARLRAGHSLDPTLLENTFSRPLYALVPELATLPGVMREAGAAAVALSGAGPAHYAMVDDAERAEEIAGGLRERLGNDARVCVVAPLPGRYDGGGM